MAHPASKKVRISVPKMRGVVSQIHELGTVSEEDRIARLRKAIQENRLVINAELIADRIVEEDG